MRICSADIPLDTIGGVSMVYTRRGGGIYRGLGERQGYDMWQICPIWNTNPPKKNGIEAGNNVHG